MLSFVNNKVVEPVKGVLAGGITPHKLAYSVAFGVAGGLFPVPGVTTLVCLIAVFLFRVNPVIVQVINLALTPADVALIPVFAFIGGWFLGDTNFVATPVDFSFGTIFAQLQNDFVGTLTFFVHGFASALAGWVVCAPLIVFSLAFLFEILFKRILTPKIVEPDKSI